MKKIKAKDLKTKQKFHFSNKRDKYIKTCSGRINGLTIFSWDFGLGEMASYQNVYVIDHKNKFGDPKNREDVKRWVGTFNSGAFIDQDDIEFANGLLDLL